MRQRSLMREQPADSPRTLVCCATVGDRFPVWAPRRSAKCEAPASFMANVDVEDDGELAVLPLCRLHSNVLERCDDKTQLAARWMPA